MLKRLNLPSPLLTIFFLLATAVAAPDWVYARGGKALPQPAIAERTPQATCARYRSAPPDTSVLASYTFDNGSLPDPQGWTSIDRTAQEANFVHVDDFAGLGGGSFGLLYPPSGNRALWCGARPGPSNPACGYAILPGYGNKWNQAFCFNDSLTGPNIEVSFAIHHDTEPGYDEVLVEFKDNVSSSSTFWRAALAIDGRGTDTLSVIIPDALFSGSTRVRIRFQSDEFGSDEDGFWNTDGAFIIDDLQVSQNGALVSFEDFESAPIGANMTTDWTSCIDSGVGDYAGLFAGNELTQLDPCGVNGGYAWAFLQGSTTIGIGEYDGETVVPRNYYSGEYIDNAVVSPPIAISSSTDNTFLQFDVYRDLPFDVLMLYEWHVRSRVGTCWGPWVNLNFVYYGSTPNDLWMRQTFSLESLIEPGATEIQVSLGVVDGCGIWGCFEEYTPTAAPYFDNVRVYRVDPNGPSWSSLDYQHFNDAFPGDGSITGTARADVNDDIFPSSHPGILFGDSACVDVVDSEHGLGADGLSGFGSSVYLLASVWPQGQPGKSGAALTQDSFRFPFVQSTSAAGADWTWLRCDTSFANGSTRSFPVADEFCADLNDNLFTPGDTIRFFYAAQNAIGEWSYYSPNAGVFDNVSDAAVIADEFTVLPTITGAGVGNILFVNRSHNPSLTGLYQSTFAHLGLATDTYDARGFATPGVEARVVNPSAQVLANYDVIIMDARDGIAVGDGTGNPLKSDDGALFLEFLDGLDRPGGVFVSGPDVAELLKQSVGAGTVALQATYINFGLTEGNHADAAFSLAPSVSGEPLGPLDGETFIAYGGCPTILDFDVMAPTGNGVLLASYGGDGSSGAVVGQKTMNAESTEVGVVIAGFDFASVRDDDTDGISDRVTYLAQVLAWLGQSVGAPTTTTSPRSTRLAQNYPNPFNPTTTIEYSLARTSHVELAIFDVTGRRIRTLVNGVQRPGEVAPQVWDGTNDGGVAVASGVYFYRLSTAEFTRTRKMVLLK